MHRLSFLRWLDRARGRGSLGVEVAVPVIDGVPLFERVGGRYPGISVRLLAHPSTHWLGDPEYLEEGRAVILDGGCGIAGCCGVMARIDVDLETVVWSDFFARGRPPLPSGLRYEFAYSQYTEALDAIPRSLAIEIGDRTG